MPSNQQRSAVNGNSEWCRARLIPTSGIKGVDEQEKRATSSLLAVMRAVPEFGHAVLRELGAPKSPLIETYTEVRFKDASGKSVIPDGAIVCERGKKRWSCLVEVKTAAAQLKSEQVSSYLDLAREHGFDGVLTISNQITASSSDSPVEVDRRKLRKASLWHFSWWRIITEAVVQHRHRGISDPDQAWILSELISYLEHDASGAGTFQDMGDQWVTVREAAHDGTLRASDPGARAVAERWEQFTQYLCLGLSQELGRPVTSPRPRNQSGSARLDELVTNLAGSGSLDAPLRVPDAVGVLQVRADLRSRQTHVSVSLDAPREGRAKSRISWLLRQLQEAPPGLRIEVSYPNARETTSALLNQAREQPDQLLYPPDPKREPRSFTLTMSRAMGQKRGKGDGSFLRETRTHTFAFYRDLVQNLKSWQARAPKLPEEPTAVPAAAVMPYDDDQVLALPEEYAAVAGAL
jgi:hypothetical protein